MRNLHLLLPAALGVVALSGCVDEEPYDSSNRYYEGRPAYRRSASYGRDYDTGYRSQVVIDEDPYYSYEGVQYYSSGDRYYYLRGPRRIYIETLPHGGRYLGRHDRDHSYDSRSYDREDRRDNYYSGSRYREDSSARNYQTRPSYERSRTVTAEDSQKLREREYNLKREQQGRAYEHRQVVERADVNTDPRDGDEHKKKEKKKKKD